MLERYYGDYLELLGKGFLGLGAFASHMLLLLWLPIASMTAVKSGL